MARLIAFDAVFFLLPFAIYALWLLATRQSVSQVADWPLRTIAYLAIGGAVLMIGAVLVFISFSSGGPGSKYVPAKMENGVIVPGHFE